MCLEVGKKIDESTSVGAVVVFNPVRRGRTSNVAECLELRHADWRGQGLRSSSMSSQGGPIHKTMCEISFLGRRLLETQSAGLLFISWFGLEVG